ncbi:MAG: hypothetical protein RLZ63_260 [Pseudomonadota bacterium]|jgi:two-component system sensor histidine kinase QseC
MTSSARTLGRYLLTWSSLAVVSMWVAIVLVGYYKGIEEAEEIIDGQLQSLAQFWQGVMPEVSALTVSDANFDRPNPYVQASALLAWKDGQLVQDSHRLASQLDWQHPPAVGHQWVNVLHGQDLQSWRMYTSIRTFKGERYIVSVMMNKADRMDLASDIALDIAWPGALLMPLLLVVLWGVSRRVTQPLRVLRADVSHVEATSSLPAGWSQNYPFVEYSALARSVQALVDRLQGQIRREKLFASDVAHELRTPLTTLALLSHQVADGDLSQIKDIKTQALRAGQILEQLLALARGEQAADVRLHKSCIDLPELAQAQTQSLMAQAQLWGHAMRCDISPLARDAQVHCDVTLLGLAVANLIRNAIVHTPSGTGIVVSVYRVGQETVLEVWDDPNNLASSSSAQEHLHDGLGLGLGLVERIMHKSHGRWVQDRPLPDRQMRSRLIWKADA